MTQRHGVCVSGCAEMVVAAAEFAPGFRSDGMLLIQRSHFGNLKESFVKP